MFLTRLVAAAFLATALATPTFAHPHLLSATPAPNSIVAAPRQLALHFSERLVVRFSSVDILNPAGAAVPMASAPAADGMGLVLTPRAPLGPGVYRVNWRAVSVDTHRLEGSYVFRVR
jgi:hypothetical protein